MKRNEIDMLNGPLLGKILLFSLPLMASGVLQLLYNAADLVVVGRYAGRTALAAVGATGALISLIVNAFIGFSVGASVVMARSIGAGDAEASKKATHTSITISLIFGIGVAIFGFFLSKTFLELMDTPDNVIEMSATYMKIYFVGVPLNMLYNFGSAILRATGDTRRPLYFLTISGLINVILNLFFVIVFHMDVDGVALATIISQGISALLVTSCLMKSDGPCKLVLKDLKIDLPTLKDITLIGLPAGLQSSLFSISNVIIQSSVNSFGDIVMSGNTAASNIDGFINVSENAIYQAALTFTGQNFGAKKYKRTKKIMWTCLASTVVLVSVISVIIYIFRTQLLGIYLPDEPEAISYGAFRMELVTLFYFVFGANDVLVGQLRGLGKSLYPMLISVFGICGVRIIWIYTVFKQTHTLEMLYISYPLSWLVSFLGMLLCYFIVSRKLPADGEVANI